MKISDKSDVLDFQPIKLEILLETPEDAEKFYAIFNYADIATALKLNKETTTIREHIAKKYPLIHKNYDHWFSILYNYLKKDAGKSDD